MAHTFLIFDFGTDEEAAQQARHRIEGWKQGFRLGNKLQFKFERKSPEKNEDSEAKHEGKKEESNESEPVRLFVRLDFSNHEKHLAQSWIERIPGDDAFKSVKSEVIRNSDSAFETTSEFFDSLS